MNVILAECEESRRVKPKAGKKTTENEERRVLGLVLLRGDIIVSVSVDGPPMKEADASKLPARAGGHGGPGMAMSAGRGMPMGIAPGSIHISNLNFILGLQGAVAGIGGPGYQAMQPGYGGRPL